MKSIFWRDGYSDGYEGRKSEAPTPVLKMDIFALEYRDGYEAGRLDAAIADQEEYLLATDRL